MNDIGEAQIDAWTDAWTDIQSNDNDGDCIIPNICSGSIKIIHDIYHVYRRCLLLKDNKLHIIQLLTLY